MKVSFAAKTDVGRLRNANEDSYLVRQPLFVVADGMGGHTAGDVASSTAVERIANQSGTASPSDPGTLAALVREANQAIWEKAQSDRSLQGMGTTCTLLYVDRTSAHIAHVGDSRAYLLRDGELQQLTEDHTLVERMVREGRLKREEAEHHPQRSIITRALGVDADVTVDLLDLELREGDRILLCSDGLSSMVGRSFIQDILQEELDPDAAAERLIEAANDAGGEDNITVVLVDLAADGAASTDAPPVEEASAEEASPPPPPPERVATDPDTGGGPGRGRSLLRRIAVPLVIVALVAGGAYAAARYALSNSWFVGVNQKDEVTIYRGIPEEIGGLTLREPEQVSRIALGDLPKFMRADVREGIKQDSLEEAQRTLSNLKERAEDFSSASGDRNKSQKTNN